MRPEDLSLSGLPKTPFGGVKSDAVADLLKRVAWDYREVLGQNRQLGRQVDELLQAREALEAQVAALEAAAAERKEPDELARTLLSSAQRTAREQREAARREAELLLKKARERAHQIENEVRASAEVCLAELAKLEELRDEVTSELRTALEAIVALGRGSPSGDEPGQPTDENARQDAPGTRDRAPAGRLSAD